MNIIILASGSPRRKELLEQIGFTFEVVISTCEEKAEGSNPAEVVCNLSKQKALDIWNIKKDKIPNYDDRDAFIVIGADTIVYCEGEILGKPKDEEDAIRMLNKLSGKCHQVYTGVTIYYRKDSKDQVHTFFEETEVEFYPMKEQEIVSYVESKDPLDKAGAYGIQGRCAAYIKGIRGDYNNVVGLPVGRLYQELKECGLI